MDKRKFKDLMVDLLDHFKRPHSRLALAGYYERLKDELTESDLESAVARAMTQSYMPTAEQLISFAGGTNAARAWDIAIAAVGKVGIYRSPAFADRVIATTLRHIGGWQKFCLTTADRLPFVRREFERVYSDSSVVGPPDDGLEFLMGIAESNERGLSGPQSDDLFSSRRFIGPDGSCSRVAPDENGGYIVLPDKPKSSVRLARGRVGDATFRGTVSPPASRRLDPGQ
jgi:hypothetical protein